VANESITEINQEPHGTQSPRRTTYTRMRCVPVRGVFIAQPSRSAHRLSGASVCCLVGPDMALCAYSTLSRQRIQLMHQRRWRVTRDVGLVGCRAGRMHCWLAGASSDGSKEVGPCCLPRCISYDGQPSVSTRNVYAGPFIVLKSLQSRSWYLFLYRVPVRTCHIHCCIRSILLFSECA
jgi:hypothetical protein